MNKTVPARCRGRVLLANAMWFLWGAVFYPLVLLQIIQLRNQTQQTLVGPYIVASNHRSVLDPLAIVVAMFPTVSPAVLPITPYVAPVHRFKKLGLWIAAKMGIIQLIYYCFNATIIPNEGTLEEKIDPLVQALGQGQSVLIFPEGRVSQEQHTLPFKRGVAELHHQTQVPIIPCAVQYRRFFIFHWVTVTLGKPFAVPNVLYNSTDRTVAAAYIREHVEKHYSTH